MKIGEKGVGLPGEAECGARRIALLAEVNRMLLESGAPESVLPRLAELVLLELNGPLPRRGSSEDLRRLGFYQLSEGWLEGDVYGYAQGLEGCVAAVTRRRHRLPLAGSPFERALEARASLYCADLAGEPVWVQEGASDFAFPAPASALLVPLLPNGAPWGVLVVTSERKEGFAASDLAFAEIVAHAFSGALGRHELLARCERQVQAYRALAAFGTTISDCDDVDRLTDLGLGQLRAQLGTDFAVRFEVQDGRLRLDRLWGRAPEGLRKRLEARPLRLGEGVAGAAAESGELVYSPSYPQDPRALPELLPFGCKTVLALPVRQRGRVASVLALYSVRGVSLDDDRLTVARTFARRLEGALERQDNLREVEATREGTLRALGLALEYRDLETKGHTDRVVNLSMRFGGRLGLSEQERQSLRWGAYLHDIGKLAIPDSVLLKPGQLEANEFEVIKQHCAIGYSTCREIPFLPEETRVLVRSHHERWDGGGYPDGLCAGSISLLARVFSLVDVYDALLSARPYKDAWPRARALAEVHALAGAHFDPELVPVFLEVAAEVPAPG